jgi:hypothetical protein
MNNKTIIVVSHERPDYNFGKYHGELFYTKEGARKFLEKAGFKDTEDFKWYINEDGTWTYFNRNDYIELMDKEINE